jgi:peptide/nickel transport system substrate-binding protein
MTRAGRSQVVALVAALSLAVAACGSSGGSSSDTTAGASGSAAPSGSSGGSAPAGSSATGGGENLVIAIADEPSTLDPQAAEDGNERAVTDNIYDTLLRRDPVTNDLVPHLATALPTQVDDTTWEFKLREGVTFTNGEPFDAAAAAYSINRVIDKNFNSAQADFYEGITGATAVDATTLRVTTAQNDPVFPARMYRLKMVPPTYSKDPAFVESPIGTGPYKFEKWDRGSQVTLTRNDDYWGDAPPIKDVTLRFISEAGTRVAGLKAGEVQLATLIPPEQTKDVPQVITRDGLEFPVFRLKNYEGTLKNAMIRQAMNYAVDKDALAKDLFSGYASVANCQTVAEGTFGYDPDLKPYPYDPDKAKQLLKDAGYNGEELTLLAPTGRWLKDAETTEAVVGYLNDVGIKIKPDVRPFSSYITEFATGVGTPQQDMGFVSASNELFDASKIETYYHKEGALSSYVNEDVTAALNDARSQTDPAKREADFHTALKIGCEDDPVFIFTVNLQDIYGASKGLTWKPRVDGSLYVPDMSVSS